MVLEAFLTGRQPREKLQCLYENLMSKNACSEKKLKCKLLSNASFQTIQLKKI